MLSTQKVHLCDMFSALRRYRHQFVGIFAWSSVKPMDQIDIKTNHHSYKLQRQKTTNHDRPSMAIHPWLYDRLHKMIQPQVFLPKWPGLLHLLLSGKNRSHGAHTCRRIEEDAPKGPFNRQLCFFFKLCWTKLVESKSTLCSKNFKMVLWEQNYL